MCKGLAALLYFCRGKGVMLWAVIPFEFLEGGKFALESNRINSTWFLSLLLGRIVKYHIRWVFFSNSKRPTAQSLSHCQQLENRLGGEEKFQERVTKHLIPCLAQFSVAMADDSLWKPLNYQILLKTRDSSPKVRRRVQHGCCALAPVAMAAGPALLCLVPGVGLCQAEDWTWEIWIPFIGHL